MSIGRFWYFGFVQCRIDNILFINFVSLDSLLEVKGSQKVLKNLEHMFLWKVFVLSSSFAVSPWSFSRPDLFLDLRGRWLEGFTVSMFAIVVLGRLSPNFVTPSMPVCVYVCVS